MLKPVANFVESTDSMCNGITSYGKVWREDAKKKREKKAQSVSLPHAPASCFLINCFRVLLFLLFLFLFFILSLSLSLSLSLCDKTVSTDHKF